MKKPEIHCCCELKKWMQLLEDMLPCLVFPNEIITNDEYWMGGSARIDFCPCCGAKIYDDGRQS